MATCKLPSIRKVGMVLKKFVIDGHPVVKVRCQGMKIHPHFNMYLPANKDKLAVYSNTDCTVGDIVVIKNLDTKLSHKICFEVERHFYKLGETYCPVTKMRCRGTDYIDSDYLTSVSGKPLDFSVESETLEKSETSQRT